MRVVIAEDEFLLREGISRILSDEGHEIIATAGDADDLVGKVRAHLPDLALTDIRMPPGFTNEGLAAALEIRRSWPTVSVCVLSQYVLAHSARALLDADGGGIGYLLKQRIAHIHDFLSDLRRIVAGEVVLDPTVVEQLLVRADQAGTPAAQLTPRQRAVLALVAEGRSNAAIAARLFISEKTVVNHLTSIYMTLGLELDDDSHRRVQAVLAFLSSRSS